VAVELVVELQQMGLFALKTHNEFGTQTLQPAHSN
jgi:hypothetical protein